THAVDGARGEAVGKPSVAGVHTNQRLNLSKPWEGTRRTCQGLEPDPGNLAVRDFRGASRNVRHGETVNPPCNRKSRTGNPSPTAGRARSLSQPSASFEARSGLRMPISGTAISMAYYQVCKTVLEVCKRRDTFCSHSPRRAIAARAMRSWSTAFV